MKKAYLYFLLPLVGLALFGAVYWQFSKDYEQRQEQRAAKERKIKENKINEDNANRLKAVEEAKAAQEKRKADRAIREAREAKDKEDREISKAARNKAINDADKIEGQVRRLNKEIEETKKEIQVIDEQKARSVAEETFLKDYVKKVESNRAGLTAVIEKIAEADKAREEYERQQAMAAAAAAKKK
jgi:hypothetical protein